MSADLFSLAIEQRDRRIEQLEAEREELRLTLASVLGYMKTNNVGQGHYGRGVRNMVKERLGIAA